MIDISKGRFWDKPWSLVDGCTPCSLGCINCWSAELSYRFDGGKYTHPYGVQKNGFGMFNGEIKTHPERLDIPMRRRKPTVYAVWNDLFHEAVPIEFQSEVYRTMATAYQHTFLVLTKRHNIMAMALNRNPDRVDRGDIWHGLTVCNQQEWAEKKKYFAMIPGRKFLSLEPMLAAIDLELTKTFKEPFFGWPDSEMERKMRIDAVILGGETGPGARPMQMKWVQSIRDQCHSAAIPFFFKSWGDHWKGGLSKDDWIIKRRLLDGRTHDSLPWGTHAAA